MPVLNKNILIITNNPMVFENNEKHPIIFDKELSFGQVLELSRNNIHMGKTLLTHPLSGSIKPYETPYKTVLLSANEGSLDTSGLEIIESAIQTAKKFYKERKTAIPERILNDFQLIDFDLIREYIL